MSMVRTEMSVCTKRRLSIAQVSLLMLAVVVPVSWGAQEEEGRAQGRCVFVKVLENPAFRARYQENLARASVPKMERDSDSEALYGSIVKASIKSGDGSSRDYLDSFSTGCVTCHNGIVSRTDTLNFRNNPETRMQMISGKHPIGMDYGRYVASNHNLRKPEDLNPNLVLVGGKVSCVTCHDPLNPEKNHMALNDRGRALCLECHNL